MNATALVMTAREHAHLRSYLFPGDGLEAAAILVCNRGTGRRSQRLLVAEQLHLPHDRSVRQQRRVTWPFSDHLPPEQITEIDSNGQSIVTIHSHPRRASGVLGGGRRERPDAVPVRLQLVRRRAR